MFEGFLVVWTPIWTSICCVKFCTGRDHPVQNLTQQIEVDIDVQTTKKPSKMFSADPFGQLKKPCKMFSAEPFGQLKNLQKCFRQIRSDSRKTCRKPGFSHDPARSHSKRRAGCHSKRRAGSHSERSFVRSFLRSFVRSFVRLFVR